MDNDLGWSFLREDAYELVFTSDTPWLPVRFKDGTTGKLAPVDWLMKMLSISLRRGQISRVRPAVFAGATTNQLRAQKSRSLDDIWEDGLEAEKLREALLSLNTLSSLGQIPLHLCRISRRSGR